MPVTCPSGRQNQVNHGHSRVTKICSELQKRGPENLNWEPSKLVMRVRFPSSAPLNYQLFRIFRYYHRAIRCATCPLRARWLRPASGLWPPIFGVLAATRPKICRWNHRSSHAPVGLLMVAQLQKLVIHELLRPLGTSADNRQWILRGRLPWFRLRNCCLRGWRYERRIALPDAHGERFVDVCLHRGAEVSAKAVLRRRRPWGRCG